MKKIIIGLVTIIVLAVVANTLIPSISSTKDLPHISYLDAFSQEEEEYLVYFYQDSCSLCEQFSPELVQAVTKDEIPIYVVDLGDEVNTDAWYDWETHNQTYPKVIGTVVDGEKVFNEGESEAKYPSNEGWTVTTNEDDEILADHSSAFNNMSPQTAEELDVSGTPSLLRVKNGELVEYVEGLGAARELLANFSK